jgi:hypothetical protein
MESLSFFNRYVLFRRNILDDLARAARPSDFQRVDFGVFS